MQIGKYERETFQDILMFEDIPSYFVHIVKYFNKKCVLLMLCIAFKCMIVDTNRPLNLNINIPLNTYYRKRRYFQTNNQE